MTACKQLLRKLDNLRSDAEIIAWRGISLRSLTSEQKAELVELRPEIREVQRVVLRDPFVPMDVQKALTGFIQVFDDLCKADRGNCEEEPGMILLNSYIEVLNAANRSLNIDLLNEELCKMLRVSRT